MRSTPQLQGDRGFTLIELLLATAVVSLVMAAAGGLFAVNRRFIQTQIQRTETVQALRTTLDMMARDLRLGGACLPTIGDFSPLDGTNSGTTDTITSRTGLVQPNKVCIYGTLTANAALGATSLTLNTVSGFQTGMGVYIQGANTGETVKISSISGTTIGISPGTTQAYTANAASVYAIDQRKYAIDTSNASLPVLTVAQNGGTPVPFASGIEALNIQYRLNRNCPNCDTVDLPSGSDWSLVTEIVLNITARSRTTESNGQYYRRSAQIIAKPRNLLPSGG